MEKLYDHKILRLIVVATVMILGISSSALFVVDDNLSTTARRWFVLLTISSATLLVMSILYAKLQRLYAAKTENELKAQQDARVDSLTGIGNRKFISEKIDEACALATAEPKHGLLLIDLNGFKQVNDTLGHQFGDDLITAVARRLDGWVAESEVGRLGGDEFAILVEATGQEELTEICQHVSTVFQKPFKLPAGNHSSGGGVGACLITNRESASDALWHADLALYDAKESKRPYRIFDEQMSKLEDRTKRLRADLEQSLKTGAGLFVEYQPILSVTGRVEALEAYLRWKHPELGLIRPLEIVAIAEKSQLIGASERFVARQVIDAAKLHTNLKFCLNVSGLQLLDDQFAKWIDTTARANGVSPRQFVIEVRETAIAKRLPQFAAAFAYFGRMGCRIAVDNFERGHASIAELGRKGVTIVKIDRMGLLSAQEERNISILRASVQLAKTLNMTVVATGVDTDELDAIARQAGFDWIEGFHLGKPGELPSLTSLKAAA
jgi:diguanylate cyclase (GGDEF)-like protein